MTTGEKIAKLRKEFNYTQEQLESTGTCFEHLGELTAADKAALMESLYNEVPGFFQWIVKIIEVMI